MTLRSVQRWLYAVLLGLLAVLIFTGVWLTFRYRPSGASPWKDLPGAEPAGYPIAQVVHGLSAWFSWLVAAGLAVVTVVRRINDRHRAQPWVLATISVPLLQALTLTGFLLPWDQLTLWAVKVDTNFDGVLHAAFDDRVRFVLLGNVEVSQATYRIWVLVHTVGLVVVMAVITVVLAMRLRAERDAPRPSSAGLGSA